MSPARPRALLPVLIAALAGVIAVVLIVSFVAVRLDDRPKVAPTSAPSEPVAGGPAARQNQGETTQPSRELEPPRVTDRDRTGPAARTADGRPPLTGTSMTAADSRLYNVMFGANTGHCADLEVRAPAIPDDELVDHLQQISDCLVDLNAPALAAEQITLTRPKVAGFEVQAQTACGTHSRYAFYCPEDQTIYVDVRSDEGPRFYGNARHGYLTLISHEFGHHLQLVGGVTRDYADQLERADPRQREELSRRFELQATCFSGVFYGATWRSVGGDQATYAEIVTYFDTHNDDLTGEGTHGSARAMRTWFAAGFNHDWNAYQRCNTWTAAPDAVR